MFWSVSQMLQNCIVCILLLRWLFVTILSLLPNSQIGFKTSQYRLGGSTRFIAIQIKMVPFINVVFMNTGGLTHIKHCHSYIFITICATAAVHPWMPHHKSTYWQHRDWQSIWGHEKDEEKICALIIASKKTQNIKTGCNTHSATVQSPPSDTITALRSRYQSLSLELIWYLRMDVKYAAMRATPYAANEPTCEISK